MISDKFKDVPKDTDTRILFRSESKLGKYDILYEKWVWDAIKGHSIIFWNDDIAGMTEEELIALVKTSSIVKDGSDFTFKRLRSGYTFVNFNFEVT